MIWKGFVAAFLLLLLGEFTYSQDISHQVLVPAARVVLKGNIIFQQTVGEPVVAMIGENDYFLIQGFQQKRLKRFDEDDWRNTGVVSYPNPVEDILNVRVWSDSPHDLRISIFNFQGVMLYYTERSYPRAYYEVIEIPVSAYKPGIFIVKVTSKDNVIYRTFKIEKM